MRDRRSKPWGRQRLLRVIARSLAAFLLLAGGWSGYLWASGNVHTVEPGILYRSAQLGPQDLERVIRSEGIRTVLNLRGNNTGSPWYDDEVAATARAGAAHLDIRLSARRVPDPETIVRLIQVMRDAPKPLLVHCQAGADRTGLAIALYDRAVLGRSIGQAATHLTLLYGHFPWLWSKTGAMDDAYRAWSQGAEG